MCHKQGLRTQFVLKHYCQAETNTPLLFSLAALFLFFFLCQPQSAKEGGNWPEVLDPRYKLLYLELKKASWRSDREKAIRALVDASF
jgi:hypothetical protein